MNFQGRTICVAALILSGCTHAPLGSTPSGLTQPGPGVPYIVQTGEQSNWITFSLPSGQSSHAIYPGPDGAMWIVLNNAIGRMDMSGNLVTYPTNYPTQGGWSITNNPDGNLYFLEGSVDGNGNANFFVGRISTAGQIQDIPMPQGNWIPQGITTGGDKNLWITLSPEGTVQTTVPSIARMTTAGVSKVFALPPGQDGFEVEPLKIVRGPHGNLWFNLAADGPNPGGLGEITTRGAVLAYQIGCPLGVIAAQDGGIWSYDASQDGYCRTDPTTLQTTEYVVGGTHNNYGVDLERGPGHILFQDQAGLGVIRQFNLNSHTIGKSIPQPSGSSLYTPLGVDENLWVTGAAVYVYVLRQISTVPANVTVPSGSSQSLVVSEKHFHGPWTVSSSDDTIATVSPTSGIGPFTVTGVSPGSATITIDDSVGNSLGVSVTVQ